MANDWALIVDVSKDCKISCRTGKGADGPDDRVDFADSRRKLVKLFERWMREGKITKRDELEAFGTVLYELIFPAPVGDFFLQRMDEFEKWRDEQKDPLLKDRRLRVELVISHLELAALPWEFLFQPGKEGRSSYFMSLKTDLVLSRLMKTGADRAELEPCEELKVLVVDMLSSADPAATGGKLPAIFKNLEEFLRDQAEKDSKVGAKCPPRVALKTTILNSPNVTEFTDALGEEPHVLHYLGNGSGAGTEGNSISLLNDEGSTRWLTHSEFADLFQKHRRPKLVFLHLLQSPESAEANFATFAPALIRMNIRAVVALRHPLTLGEAQNFTKQFYQSLLNCESVAVAVQEGRYSLFAHGKHSAVGSPVLFLQSKDGPLAVLPAAPPPPSPGLGPPTGIGQPTSMSAAGGAMNAPRPTPPTAPALEAVPTGSAPPGTHGGPPGSFRPELPVAPGERGTETGLDARAQQLKPSESGPSGN